MRLGKKIRTLRIPSARYEQRVGHSRDIGRSSGSLLGPTPRHVWKTPHLCRCSSWNTQHFHRRHGHYDALTNYRYLCCHRGSGEQTDLFSSMILESLRQTMSDLGKRRTKRAWNTSLQQASIAVLRCSGVRLGVWTSAAALFLAFFNWPADSDASPYGLLANTPTLRCLKATTRTKLPPAFAQ